MQRGGTTGAGVGDGTKTTTVFVTVVVMVLVTALAVAVTLVVLGLTLRQEQALEMRAAGYSAAHPGPEPSWLTPLLGSAGQSFWGESSPLLRTMAVGWTIGAVTVEVVVVRSVIVAVVVL